MTTTPHDTIPLEIRLTWADRKHIIYDWLTREYAMHLDGELIGFCNKTYQHAEVILDNLIVAQEHGKFTEPLSQPVYTPLPPAIEQFPCAGEIRTLYRRYHALKASGRTEEMQQIKARVEEIKDEWFPDLQAKKASTAS